MGRRLQKPHRIPDNGKPLNGVPPTYQVECTWCPAIGLSYKPEPDDALAELYFAGWREAKSRGKEGTACPKCVVQIGHWF